jgi:hypothetical protein
VNPKEIAIYKTLIAIEHLIEKHQNIDQESYLFFFPLISQTQICMEKLMADIGRRHLIEADFLNHKCD